MKKYITHATAMITITLMSIFTSASHVHAMDNGNGNPSFTQRMPNGGYGISSAGAQELESQALRQLTDNPSSLHRWFSVLMLCALASVGASTPITPAPPFSAATLTLSPAQEEILNNVCNELDKELSQDTQETSDDAAATE